MKYKGIILSFILAAFLAGCSGGASSADGGSEFGNPSRGVIGTVVDGESAALAQGGNSSDCPVDAVIATDSSGVTTVAEVESDCSFDLTLTPDKAYVISFTQDDEFVATMIVNNGPNTLESTVVFVSDGDADIDLGNVTIIGGEAFPDNEPSEQCDRDGDGENDFEDDDDDDDGRNDDDEEDCDDDDFSDDSDDEDEECDDENEDGDDDNSGSGGGED